MRIAVNTRFLLKNKLTGLGHFTLEVVRQLVLNHPDDTFIFLFDRPYDSSFVFAPNIEPIIVHPPARATLLFTIWFEWSIPAILRSSKADVFFSPDNFLSLRTRLPTLLVIHDLAYLHTPDGFKGMQLLYYRYFMPKFARRADRIATVSDATRQDILQQYDIATDKVEVVGLGLNEGFEFEGITVRQDYFVHLGTIQPRKNVIGLLRAFELYKNRTGRLTKLKFIGGKGWNDEEFYTILDKHSYKQDVELLGYRSNEEISHILNHASALLCVSYFEGFGMPVIEAQRCGCPVIASNTSSLPEASGGAALLVNPSDDNAIADAMKKIMEDSLLRAELIEKGFNNIKRFSWEKTADAIYSLLQELYKQGVP